MVVIVLAFNGSVQYIEHNELVASLRYSYLMEPPVEPERHVLCEQMAKT